MRRITHIPGLPSMNKLLTCVLLAVLSAAQLACDSRATQPTPGIQQLEGHWVRKKYLDSLAATRSQFAEDAESVSVYAKDMQLTWANYHEGYWAKILGVEQAAEGPVVLMAPPETEPSAAVPPLQIPVRAIKDGAGTIVAVEFLDKSLVAHPHETFVWLNIPLQKHANKQLLAGRYRDQKGNPYTFSDEGVATWPDRTFAYELPLDPMQAECDYIRTDAPKNPAIAPFYGFKWNGERLDLYKIVPGELIACEPKPFASLTRL